MRSQPYAAPREAGFACVWRYPVLIIFCLYLGLMVGLSLPWEGVAAVCHQLRWPMLGVAALLGGLVWLAERRRYGTSDALMIFFLSALVLSTGWALDPDYTFQRAGSVVLLALATFVGLGTWVQGDRFLPEAVERARAVTDALWLLGIGVALVGLAVSGGGVAESGRYVGLSGRATGAGAWSALFLPLAIYQACCRFRGLASAFAWLAVGVLSYQLVLSGARMALATAILTSIVLLYNYMGMRSLVFSAAGLVGLGLWIGADPTLAKRVLAKAEVVVRPESVGTLTGRLDRWKFALEQFQVSPVYGHGFGASRTLVAERDARRFAVKQTEFSLHSDQLEVMVDLGLIGATLFGLFWLATVAGMIQAYLGRPGPLQPLAAAYAGSVTFIFGDTFMHGAFLSAGNAFTPLCWSMVAILISLTRAMRQRPVMAQTAVGDRKHKPSVALARPTDPALMGTEQPADTATASPPTVQRPRSMPRPRPLRRLPSAQRVLIDR